ncbi:hypothetical protein J7M07_05990 [bacterium]|nr:hypothetical protein [bacterium]
MPKKLTFRRTDFTASVVLQDIPGSLIVKYPGLRKERGQHFDVWPWKYDTGEKLWIDRTTLNN